MLRLLDGHSLTTRALIAPESMGLSLAERDSTASPSFCAEGAPALQVNDWVQDLDGPGAGIVWRIKAIDREYDTGTLNCSLEHMIQSLGDRVLGEVKTSAIAGGSSCTARQAVEFILNKQSDWVLGDFAYGSVSNPYHFNGETLKAALETVSASLTDPVWEYDFTVYPFRLHIRQQSQTADSELRAGRNITSLKYTIDKSRMFTRFYPIGKNNKKPSPEYVSKNENVYGRVDKKDTDQSKTTASELVAWANEQLARHAEPLVTVTISGLDLSEATGESLDHLTVCHLCRVPLPEYDTTILEKVTKLSWRDKIKDPESVSVTLANALSDVQTILKEEKARGGGAARTAALLNEENELLIGDVESGLYTRITQTASELRDEAHNEAQSLRSIISQTAESIQQTLEDDVHSLRSVITQTAASIRQEITDEANSLRSAITEQAGQISLVVEGTGANAHIKPAAIVASINDAASTVKLSADHIILDGDAVADSLSGKDIFAHALSCDNLSVDSDITCGTLTADGVETDALYIGSADAATAIAGIGTATESGGQITIPTTRLNGSAGPNINFNIAATQYYQDGVAAARIYGAANASLGGAWNDGEYTVNVSYDGSVRQSQAMTELDEITGGTPSRTGTWGLVVPCSVSDTDGATVFSDNITVNASSVYDAGATVGWDAARAMVEAPGAGTDTSFTVKVPSATQNQQETYTFNISKGATPGSSGYAAVSRSGTVVGRIAIGNWYDAGYDAASPASAAIGSKVTGATYNLSVTKADGTVAALTVNCSGPAADGAADVTLANDDTTITATTATTNQIHYLGKTNHATNLDVEVAVTLSNGKRYKRTIQSISYGQSSMTVSRSTETLYRRKMNTSTGQYEYESAGTAGRWYYGSKVISATTVYY